MIEPIKLDSINLFVENMERTLKFYSLLGFLFDKESNKKDYVKISLGNVSLCFYTEKIVKQFFKNEDFYAGPNHQYELSFRVDEPEKVDSIYEKIIKNGYTSIKKPVDTEWNQRTAFITDPDNNLIEICAFLYKTQ